MTERAALHIVLVNQWYPPAGGWGGTASYAYHMAHALADLGHTVTVITAGDPGEPAVDGDGSIAIRRVRRVAVPRWMARVPVLSWYIRTLRHLLYSVRVARSVRQLERKRPIDVVEFPEVNAEGLVYMFLPRRVPVVIRCHTPHLLLKDALPAVRPYDYDLIWRMERRTIRSANAVTAPSIDLARRIASACALTPDFVRVIPNPLPVQHFRVVPEIGTGAEIEVLYVGRIDRPKGVMTLAEAVHRVARHVPIHLVLAGSTDAHEQAARIVSEILDLHNVDAGRARVSFVGAVSEESLLGYYERAAICVVPSELYESFSYTCAQAMAAGRPVIATRSGGIPETVAHEECGLIVPPGDAGALAQSILRLALDAELRAEMGRRGRSIAERLFDAPDVACRSLALYREAMIGVRHHRMAGQPREERVR